MVNADHGGTSDGMMCPPFSAQSDVGVCAVTHPIRIKVPAARATASIRGDRQVLDHCAHPPDVGLHEGLGILAVSWHDLAAELLDARDKLRVRLDLHDCLAVCV